MGPMEHIQRGVVPVSEPHTIDTPKTVAKKGQGVRLALLAFTHYIGENHPGDWPDCWCYPKDTD